MTLYRESAGQIVHTYVHLSEMGYRPAAPGDGFGNLTTPINPDLTEEALAYARAWGDDEDRLEFHIGCPSYDHRPALIYAVEAARMICGLGFSDEPGRRVVINLLRAALDELERPDDAAEVSAIRECECGGQEFNYVAGIESVDRWAARIDERLNALMKAINEAGRPN